jgi:acyl-CoA synthetase (NDP forming)
VPPIDLAPLMNPASIAVVGASQRMTRATRVVANLQRFGYRGRIFPINPRYHEVLGLPCYPDLASTPEPAHSVVVAIPAEQVPAVLTAALTTGVRGAVVLSSGFGEAGPAGRARQAELERLAERGLLICGPNCYGVFNIRVGACQFSADVAEPLRPGGVGLVSQSGGFSHAIGEYLMQQRRVGLSYIVSCGNQAGLTVEDYVEFLVEDAATTVVGAFVEGFKQPERFRRAAARARELRKPIVVLKVGRSENARQAMLAHTGSLAGTPEIIEAALKQWGAVSVSGINEMIDTLALLSAASGYRRQGWRVGITSGLGGECGRAADAADRAGIELPPLSDASVERLRGFMPDFANPRNPLDGTGAMYEDARIFPQLFDVLLREEALDILVVNLRVNVPKPGGSAPSREFSRAMSERLRQPPTASWSPSARSPAATSTPRSSRPSPRPACRFWSPPRRRCRPYATRASTDASSTGPSPRAPTPVRRGRSRTRSDVGCSPTPTRSASSASSGFRWSRRSPRKMRRGRLAPLTASAIRS